MKGLSGACVAAMALMVVGVAAQATGQPIRVRLIQPEGSPIVPPDALRTFKQAILGAGDDVAFVPTLAEASDLIEFTGYRWGFNPQLGVTQTWIVSFRPLDHPGELPAARARPANFAVTVPGETLEASMSLSAEMLRERFRLLLARFQPVVPK